MAMRYFNRASSLTGVREIAALGGTDFPAAMRAVGLGLDLLRKPEERIDFAAVSMLFEHCAVAWDMPDFGLRIAQYQHLDILGPVALVTRMERDLRAAMTAMTQNLVIHTNALVAVLEEQGDTAALLLDIEPVPTKTWQYMLASIAVARNVLEQAGGARIDFLEVTFRHAGGGIGRKAESFFRCPVRFGAERNGLYFDRAVLDRPIERSDTAYHAIISRYLTTTRQEVAGRTGDAARAEISRQMELGDCTLDSLARGLRMEPRSLQRRLKQEGLSFRDLMDDWRRARALSLVTHTRLPMSEVSLAVGFSDQSIFSRAFTRWYGETPLSYRQRDAAALGGTANPS